MAAKSIGCDTTFICMPLLTNFASAIGGARALRIKEGWEVPSILWTAIVGESGSAKTPAIQEALKPIKVMQETAMKEYLEQKAIFDEKMVVYQNEVSAWKRKHEGAPPTKPVMPRLVRYTVGDETVEALAEKLLENPLGFLLVRDELNGWFGSFNSYSRGKSGSDESFWLSAFNGGSHVIDRKTGETKTIYIPNARVSIAGGIQPGILRKALNQGNRA
jgi:hypothetical protein